MATVPAHVPVPRVPGDTTELSEGDQSIPESVEETSTDEEQSKREFIVFSHEEGNTAAGNLLQNLIQQVKLLSRQQHELSEKLTSFLSRLETLEKNQPFLVNEEAIEKVTKEFNEIISNNAIQQERMEALSERMDSLGTGTQEEQDIQMEKIREVIKEELKKEMDISMEHKLVEQKAELEKVFEDKLSKERKTIIEQLSSKDSTATTVDLPISVGSLISQLNGLLDTIVPKERRMSDTHKRNGRPHSSSFSDNQPLESSLRTHRSTSISSSGHGTMSKRGSDLSMIDEQSIMELSAIGSSIGTSEKNCTSTPNGKKDVSLNNGHIEQNVANVLYSMSDLADNLQVLVSATST